MVRLQLVRLLGIGAACLSAVAAFSQSSVPSDVRLHAIMGARIEIGDGRVIEKGNLVIRGGVIVAVGTDVPAPAGAEILDGRGLTIYPGFIDCYTTKGLKVVDPEPVQDAAPPAGEYASAFMREANRKGIRPQFEARQALSLDDGFLKPYWSAGFTSAAIAPSGALINGQMALVNLSGRPSRDCVLAPTLAMCLALDGNITSAPNTYPGSLLGKVAQVRQALLDAAWLREVAISYQAGGADRAPSDPVLESLQAVLTKSMPATFEADTAAQIDRSLKVSDEFGLRPILVGGQEAFRRLDRIKASGAPILLSLKFGLEPMVSPPKAPVNPAESTDDMEPEPADRLAERKRLYQETLHNVQDVANAGIPFAFSSRGLDSPKDFMDSIRKIVRAGLAKEAALRALTISAAKICGVEGRLGTLEPGKIANVIVMSGDFLDEKTTVKMVYVDGHKIDPARKADAPGVPRPQFGDGVGR